MSSLAPADFRRLRSSLALFDSNHQGEQLAAISAVKRILSKAGLGFADLTVEQALPKPEPRPEPQPWPTRPGPARAPLLRPHQREARLLIVSGYSWSEWEQKFLASIAAWDRPPSDKQTARLRELSSVAAHWRAEQKGGACVDF